MSLAALHSRRVTTRMMPGDADGNRENPIGWALAERIGRAVIDRSRPPFHVIITLPVHPEGRLNDGAVMTQIHWTMQSLVFGSQSLLNRVRRYFKARELYDAKAMSWSEIEKKVLDDPSTGNTKVADGKSGLSRSPRSAGAGATTIANSLSS